jgi:uncharacterized Ntn-hydrolase superfamily protein
MTHLSDLYATYSIVARDVNSGDLGVAVQTHQMGVGRLVPWARPGVGVVATQSLVNAAFGPLGLAMMAEGVPAPRVVEALVASDDRPEVRQFAVVDAQGRAAAWTGAGLHPRSRPSHRPGLQRPGQHDGERAGAGTYGPGL